MIDFLDQNYTTYWQDPSTFWAPSAPNAHILGNPLTFIVVELKRLDAAGMLATLQRPLRCLALHRLWKQFRSIGKAELPLVAKSILEAGLFPEISEKQLLDDCSSFTEAGSRYHRIAEKLGIGSLGLLGNEIPKSVSDTTPRRLLDMLLTTTQMGKEPPSQR